MPRENFDVEVPDGTHLGFSRDTDGAYRAHLFDDDTNELVGHAELFEPERHHAGSQANPDPVYIYVTENGASDGRAQERTKAEDLLGNLIVLGVLVAFEKATPHVKKWWSNRARPALKSAWQKVAKHRPRRNQIVAPETPTSTEEASNHAGDDVIPALEAYRASMSSAEARDRFVAALMAKMFSEEQVRILRDARIEAGDRRMNLESAAETVTAEQVEQSIRSMLEANPTLLNAENLAQLGQILGIGRSDGAYVPVRRQQITEALQLTDGKD